MRPIALVLLLAGCTSGFVAGNPSGDDGAPGRCDDRPDGALITIAVGSETVTFWSTDGTFIDGAMTQRVYGTRQVPDFGGVVLGGDCDPQWSWHVDPAAVEWADFTMELCDALPSTIEADPEAWIQTVGGWCPWSAIVTAVDDRR